MLQQLKKALVERTVDVYMDMRLDSDNYSDHFSGMGDLLSKIDSYTSSVDALRDVMNGHFDVIGLCDDDDQSITDFLAVCFQTEQEKSLLEKIKADYDKKKIVAYSEYR